MKRGMGWIVVVEEWLFLGGRGVGQKPVMCVPGGRVVFSADRQTSLDLFLFHPVYRSKRL